MNANSKTNRAREIFLKHPLLIILVSAGLFRVLCGITNVGVMAIDDFVYMLKLAFPAQNVGTIDEVLAQTWVHPPLPMVLLNFLSQWPLVLGLKDPMHQIQFVYALMGLVNVIPVWVAYQLFAKVNRHREAVIAGLLVGFHCAMLFFSTRVLFETFSMPLIALSLYFLTNYSCSLTKRDLLLAMVFIVAASLVRFQSGVCYVAMVAYLVSQKVHRKDLAFFLLMSAAFFVLSGLVDVLLGRGFHESVLGYIGYNINHSSDYGTSGPLNYLLLFVGMSLPPFLIRRWKGFAWKSNYETLKPALYFFGFFLVAHSLVPHKEDRFMIPIAPVFLILLVPLIEQLFVENKTKRIAIFATINLFLLVLASFFTSQWNVIGIARYLDRNPQIKSVVNYHGSLVFFPTSYMNRPDVEQLSMAHHNSDQSKALESCSRVIAVRDDIRKDFESNDWPVQKITSSAPGPIEWLIVQLNRKHNGRRASIHLYQRANCTL